MSGIHEFIQKYLAKYLAICQISNPFIETDETLQNPPTSTELEMLIPYLLEKGVDPVIIGSIAVIRYLNITDEDIKARTFRPASMLELAVSKKPTTPLEGWHSPKESEGMVWVSPGGGYVDFVIIGKNGQPGFGNYVNIVKDPESVAMGCPLADISTLFKMKLDLNRKNDLGDLLNLVSRVGIPKDLDCQIHSHVQKNNLELIRRWASLRLQKE